MARRTSWKTGEYLRSEIWFIPMMSLIGATLFAVATILVDRRLIGTGALQELFARNPEAIRSALSVVASSILTFTALVFTITMVVVQQAANRLSPRVIAAFLRDRMSQTTLGVFMGTFAYSLLVLRAIRSPSEGVSFVPGISVAIVFLAVFASLGVFVAYLHHISTSLQVTQIAARIAVETDEAIDAMYPDPFDPDREVKPDLDIGTPVHWRGSAGYLQGIDSEALVDYAGDHDLVVEIARLPGEFIPRGGQVANVSPSAPEGAGPITHTFHLGSSRSTDEDVAFGLRQLVDIGEKALSPGVNDPTTAVEVLDRIHDLLRRLATRSIPSHRVFTSDGDGAVVVPGPTWEALVELAVSEIAHYGRESIQVRDRLTSMLEDLLTVVPRERREVLREKLKEVTRSDDTAHFEPGELAVTGARKGEG